MPENSLETAKKSRPHLPFLDGIRALAALYVVLHHASTNLRYLGAPTLGPFLDKGHYAVDVFIVLSGFSLMLPVALFGELRGGGRSFLARRAQRILPPYLFALALAALVGLTIISKTMGTVWDNSLPITFKGVLTHLTLTQDLFLSQSHKINYPLWSVSVESHIYLLFPLIVLAFARFRGWTVALGAIALGYALQLLLTTTGVNTDPNGVSPYYVGLFSFGCLASQLSVTHSDRLRWFPLATVLGALVAMRLAKVLWRATFHQEIPEQATSLFIGIAAASALLALASGQWEGIRKALSWRPLVWVGGFAYSVYLIHAPVLQLVWQYGVHPIGFQGRAEPALLALIATPLVVLAAWTFSLVCEKPFIPRSPAAERKAAP